MKIRLVPATPDDQTWLEELRRAVYQDLFVATWGGWDEARHVRHWASCWGRGNIHVVEVAGMRVGMIQLLDEPNRVEVGEIQIHPVHQGKGIGTQLLLDAMARAHAQQKKLSLSTGLQNRRAVHLYERLGFRHVARSETHFQMEARPGDPTVRPLEPTDSIVALTSLLHRAYAVLGNMGLNYTAVDQSAEVTAQRIRGGTCYVATLGRELVGTIVVRPTCAKNECAYFTRPGVASAHQFAVDPLHQGKGLGRLLLQQAEHWALQAGFRELAMDTAEPAAHLVDFYGRLGYRPVSTVQWPGKVYRSVVLGKVLVGHA